VTTTRVEYIPLMDVIAFIGAYLAWCPSLGGTLLHAIKAVVKISYSFKNGFEIKRPFQNTISEVAIISRLMLCSCVIVNQW
jgi:hypothetical protein